MTWKVSTTKKVDKQIDQLPEGIRLIFLSLLKEIELYGPYRANWKHFGKLRGSRDVYHCHISAGRPTYVVCWEVINKKVCLVEVFYAGTHENAPY